MGTSPNDVGFLVKSARSDNTDFVEDGESEETARKEGANQTKSAEIG